MIQTHYALYETSYDNLITKVHRKAPISHILLAGRNFFYISAPIVEVPNSLGKKKIGGIFLMGWNTILFQNYGVYNIAIFLKSNVKILAFSTEMYL